MEYYCQQYGIDLRVFDVENADAYSLPNLVRTMKTNPFALADHVPAIRCRPPVVAKGSFFSVLTDFASRTIIPRWPSSAGC